MESPRMRDSHWLMQHLYINDRTSVDSPQDPRATKGIPNSPKSRDVSPGRSESMPIIVPGEEAPPLIVVESRDISPEPRVNESHVHHSSPKSDKRDLHLHHGKDHGSRSRTSSPPLNSRRSHKTSISDENVDFAFSGDKSNTSATNLLKLVTNESNANSDAITTPHANRKDSKKYNRSLTLTSNTSVCGNLSPTSEKLDVDGIPNFTSMTSSLTSMDSKDDLFEEIQTLPTMLPKQSATMTRWDASSSKTKNLLPHIGERLSRSKQRINLQVVEKVESVNFIQPTSHRKEKRERKTDVSVVGNYPSTPMSTAVTTPDIIYDALNDGSTSCSPLENGMSSLPYNLSGVLRGSSSDTASFFHDFHNPNIALSPKTSPLRTSTVGEKSKGEASSECVDGPCLTASKSLKESTRGKLTENHNASIRSLVDNDQEEVVLSSSNNDDITNHSILQLCTEDLMCDDTNRVNAALIRLYEVCCLVAPDRNNNKNLESSSVASTSSTSPLVLNRIRFIKAGGHALIVGVMKKYAKIADVQASACKLIHQLILMDEYSVQSSSTSTNGSHLHNRNGNSGAFNELFSAIYGMDCVISALQRFRPPKSHGTHRNGDVYDLACGALVAIVCSSFKMVDRLLQHDTRYISIFLKAMHAPINSNSTGVNRVIYYVLKQFPQYVNEIVVAGGLEEVINEMKYFPDSMEVQYCGCAAIGTFLKKNSRMIMSSLSTQIAQRFGDRSVVDYVVTQLEAANLIVLALKSFPHNEDIQGKGVIALCNMTISAADTKVNAAITCSIKKAGGLSAIGIALENFPHNQTVQDHGCMAIKTLLEYPVAVPMPE